MNRVILIGNLTRDMDLKYTGSGMAIGKTAIATNRRYKDKNGEQKEEVCFIDLTLFGRTAEIANQYLRKGSKVAIEGRLVLDQWTGNDGVKRSKHSIAVENIQMLDCKEQSQSAPAKEQQTPPPAKEPEAADVDIDYDEIPF